MLLLVLHNDPATLPFQIPNSSPAVRSSPVQQIDPETNLQKQHEIHPFSSVFVQISRAEQVQVDPEHH
jgi:hypothetical protein